MYEYQTQLDILYPLYQYLMIWFDKYKNEDFMMIFIANNPLFFNKFSQNTVLLNLVRLLTIPCLKYSNSAKYTENT